MCSEQNGVDVRQNKQTGSGIFKTRAVKRSGFKFFCHHILIAINSINWNVQNKVFWQKLDSMRWFSHRRSRAPEDRSRQNRMQAAVNVHCRQPIIPGGHTVDSPAAACSVRPIAHASPYHALPMGMTAVFRFYSAVLAIAIPSVCPSVCHTPVLCQNDCT